MTDEFHKEVLTECRGDFYFCDTVDDLLNKMYYFVEGLSYLYCHPVEDVEEGRIGFLMMQQDRRQIFWTKLSDTHRACAWRKVLRTPQGRTWTANGDKQLWILTHPDTDPGYTEDLMRC